MKSEHWGRHQAGTPRGSRPATDSTVELSNELGTFELVVTGNGAVSCIPLSDEGEFLIGRGEAADLRLPSNSVSRRHAKLRVCGSELTIEDLDSSNGTVVRGKRLPPRCETSIRAGESFLVGDFVLVPRARRETACASSAPGERDEPPTDAVVQAPAMVALYQQIEPVARSGINVLILGETGVGKDVLARRVHDLSERRNASFLRLNCAAFSEALLESELFGHEKGAFTGATCRKPGLLSTASGGTVFLDEVGEMPQHLQAKLLQVFETHEVLSVGGLKPHPIDVRFIAATNRDLEQEALRGSFRADLYYRLAAFTVVIPPLRERRDDILPLAREFLRRANERRSSPSVPAIRGDAATCLLDYSWPGNVRELRNVIERALVLSDGAVVCPEHLPLSKWPAAIPSGPPTDAPATGAADLHVTNLTPKEIEERQRILDALTSCAGNQSKAAEKLGMSRSTLLNRLDAYRIGRPRKRPG